jgi:hypothetical protein
MEALLFPCWLQGRYLTRPSAAQDPPSPSHRCLDVEDHALGKIYVDPKEVDLELFAVTNIFLASRRLHPVTSLITNRKKQTASETRCETGL